MLFPCTLFFLEDASKQTYNKQNVIINHIYNEHIHLCTSYTEPYVQCTHRIVREVYTQTYIKRTYKHMCMLYGVHKNICTL